jgi:hypothetical protein
MVPRAWFPWELARVAPGCHATFLIGDPAAAGVFDGIQPPDRRADELRDQLDELLTEATGTLAELRIAARRGELAELPELAAPLTKVADQLHAFAEAHA